MNDPGADILSIVKDYDLPTEFPEKILNQAVRVGKDVSEADCAGRLDLRDWQMVTIDGEDAKDLDDAVSLTMKDENYQLGVHIADVTNYVQEKSALDREALKRGTSVYLADRVIPMLPHVLSNGICSLNAGEDRLALSCIMTVSPKGEVIDHQIAETVIRVDKRMSYTGVSKVLAEEPEALEEDKDFVPMIQKMQELQRFSENDVAREVRLILIFRRQRLNWMRRGNQLISNLMRETVQRRSSKILCFLPMRQWQKNIFGERFHFSTERMKFQMKRR